MNPELQTEGIGQLPMDQGAKMPRIPSRDLYDATLEAIGQAAPEAVNQYRGAMRTAMSDVEIPPQIVDILIAMFEYLMDHRDEYETVVSTLVEQGIVPPLMLPEHFDQTYIGTRLAALHELKQDTAERSMPMEGMPMAQGGLADVTKYLQSQGRGGDTILAHINPEEAALLKAFGGSGTINPNTGLPEFKTVFERAFDVNTYSGAIRSVSRGLAKLDDGLRKVVSSKVGRIIATVALTMMGVPPWLANAGVAAYSGGSLKDVLVAGAMGYIGSGGTVMGVNPLNEISKFVTPFAGAQGTLMNTAVTSAALGTGAGLLQGQSLSEALKSGAMAGAQSGAMQGFGLANPTNADPKTLQTFESLSPNSYSLSGNTAAQVIDGQLVPGSGGGIPPPSQLEPLGVGLDPSLNYPQALKLANDFDLDPSVANPYRGASGSAASPSGTSPGAASVSPKGFYLADNEGLNPATARVTPAGAGSPKGFYLGDNEGVNPATARAGTQAGTQAGATRSSIIGRAEDFAKAPSFDNFGKIFVDPNATTMIGKYGPGAAAVLGATALSGGFKAQPAETKPGFDYDYTGQKYINDNPHLFRGDLRTGQFSSNRPTGVPTGNMYFNGIPVPQINAPMLPTYNTGPVMGRARGGNVDFPRKIGQIDGPGTATSDSIPAMLSDGEFVFTARAVRNAGGGSRRKGAAKMYKLMKSLENGPLGSK